MDSAHRKSLQKIKKHFHNRYGLVLPDSEAEECYSSLIYYAKAVVAFNKQKELGK